MDPGGANAICVAVEFQVRFVLEKNSDVGSFKGNPGCDGKPVVTGIMVGGAAWKLWKNWRCGISDGREGREGEHPIIVAVSKLLIVMVQPRHRSYLHAKEAEIWCPFLHCCKRPLCTRPRTPSRLPTPLPPNL